jgi:hypothetical protein
MKFFIKRQQFGEQGHNNLETSSTSTTEIPPITITWLTIIYVLVNVVSTSISNYIQGSSQRMNDSRSYELKDQNFRLQVLQRVLEIDTPKERKASLKLLIAAGLLDKELEDFINDTTNEVPKWPHADIERLSSFLITGAEISQRSAGSTVPTETQHKNNLPTVPLGTTPYNTTQ